MRVNSFLGSWNISPSLVGDLIFWLGVNPTVDVGSLHSTVACSGACLTSFVGGGITLLECPSVSQSVVAVPGSFQFDSDFFRDPFCVFESLQNLSFWGMTRRYRFRVCALNFSFNGLVRVNSCA